MDTKLSPRDIMHPRNICNQCLFTLCVIKQTLNYSFSTIQYICFVVSSIMSKLCLLFRPNVAYVNQWNKFTLDRWSRNQTKWVTWGNYIFQTSFVTYVFYCTFSSHHNVENNREKFKKILRQLLLLRNHLIALYLPLKKGFA